MKNYKHPLITSKYTQIRHEDDSEIVFGSPHYFNVVDSEKDHILSEVFFQKGPVKEEGVNGVHNEDVIAMVICRLESFQNGKYRSKENDMAIQKLEEALMWLRKRTNARVMRNVEGTSEV